MSLLFDQTTTYADIDDEVVAVEDVDVSVDVEALEQYNELSQLSDEIVTAQKAIDSLEGISGLIEKVSEADEIHPEFVASIQMSVEMLSETLSIPGDVSVLNIEDIESDTRAHMEAVTDTVKEKARMVYAAIKEAIRKIIAWISDLFKKLRTTTKKQIANLKAIRKELAKKSGKKVKEEDLTFEDPDAVKSISTIAVAGASGKVLKADNLQKGLRAAMASNLFIGVHLVGAADYLSKEYSKATKSNASKASGNPGIYQMYNDFIEGASGEVSSKMGINPNDYGLDADGYIIALGPSYVLYAEKADEDDASMPSKIKVEVPDKISTIIYPQAKEAISMIDDAITALKATDKKFLTAEKKLRDTGIVIGKMADKADNKDDTEKLRTGQKLMSAFSKIAGSTYVYNTQIAAKLGGFAKKTLKVVKEGAKDESNDKGNSDNKGKSEE